MEMVNIKAMPGLIPAPNSGSFVEKIRKNIGSQMGQTDKKHLKNKTSHDIVSAEINSTSSSVHELMLFTFLRHFFFILRTLV